MDDIRVLDSIEDALKKQLLIVQNGEITAAISNLAFGTNKKTKVAAHAVTFFCFGAYLGTLLIFMDTEFTNLDSLSLPDLISIGLVAEEG